MDFCAEAMIFLESPIFPEGWNAARRSGVVPVKSEGFFLWIASAMGRVPVPTSLGPGMERAFLNE